MDDPAAPRERLVEALRFLRAINRRLCGTAAALRPIKRWSRTWDHRQAIRMLDVGTGAADIPLAIVQWARRAGFNVHVTAVDLHPTTLALARQAIGNCPDITLVQADARDLAQQFALESFDCAHAGLFLHHLHDLDVMTVLRVMDRLTRRGADRKGGTARVGNAGGGSGGVIWNDLLRGPIGALGARALSLAAPPAVRHDAIVSVRAGFTRREALDLASRAGLTNLSFRRHLFYRFTLVSQK